MRQFTVFTRFNGQEIGTTVSADDKAGAKRAVGGTITKVWEVCQGCQKAQPNVGRWRQEGCPHTRLCGMCKSRWWAKNPKNIEDLKRDVQAFASALDKAIEGQHEGEG